MASKYQKGLDLLKGAKNYVKKKAKSFGDGAPKSTATSVTATKPKSTATSVTATKPQPRQLDFNKAKKSVVGIAGAAAGAGYIAGRNSGSKSAPTKSASTEGGGGGSQKTTPKYVEPKGGNIASRTDNSDGSKVGPNMSQVNKPNANKPDANKPERRKGPSGPTMTSMSAPSTGPKPTNKDEKVDLKKRGPSRPSMTGFRHGGAVGATKMSKVRTAKPRNINGIAQRGLTRAKHR